MLNRFRINCWVVGAVLALHGASFAQAPAAGSGIAEPGIRQPLDMRVGVLHPAAPGPMSDAGTRLPASGAETRLAAPVLVPLGKDYRVAPNDLIDIEVYDLDNTKRTLRVNAAGAISLPLIGTVIIAGLSSHEIESLVASRYREKYLQNPQVSVFIKEFAVERITVEGAVSRPGIYPLSGQITLLRALALAGGFGHIANTSEVMLYRVNEQKVREVAVYDVEKIRAGKNEDPVIRGDDLIVVQRDSSRRLLKDSLFRDIIDSINPFSVLGR